MTRSEGRSELSLPIYNHVDQGGPCKLIVLPGRLSLLLTIFTNSRLEDNDPLARQGSRQDRRINPSSTPVDNNDLIFQARVGEASSPEKSFDRGRGGFWGNRSWYNMTGQEDYDEKKGGRGWGRERERA